MLCPPVSASIALPTTTPPTATTPTCDTNNNADTANSKVTLKNFNSHSNNNSPRQQNYEYSMTATIREIKSRNLGSLSPLCSISPANNHSNGLPFVTNGATNNNSQPLVECRQAISMERLNCVQVNQRNNCTNAPMYRSRNTNGKNKENSGSLSSGGSNTSIDDDLGPENEEQSAHQATGLTRSASRVSRFKSAKEFFERLSSVNSNPSPPVKPENKPTTTDRPRGTVASRYTAVTAARANSHANLTTITSPPRSRTLSTGAFTRPIDSNKSVSSIDVRLFSESPQSPRSGSCNSIVFEGDNVIIGSGSLLNKRNKQLKIKFDENTTLTFEYPSEEALLAEPDSPAPESPVPQQQAYQLNQQPTNDTINHSYARKSKYLSARICALVL